MSDGRRHLSCLWELAESLAVQSGKPLHAFLVLHQALTRPPPVLRRLSTTTATDTAAVYATSVPLHVAAWDAEWKCEELATRVRAAEYILYPDASPSLNSSPRAPATASCSPASHRTLSRAAALESLELAEQTLAPVFAASSFAVGAQAAPHSNGSSSNGDHARNDSWRGSNIVSSPSPAPAPARDAFGRQRSSSGSFTGAKEEEHRDGDVKCSFASWEDVMQEVADVHRPASGSVKATGNSGSAAALTFSDSPAKRSNHTGSAWSITNAPTRVTSMYFLNESTVTALAWPLASFSLHWPVTPDANYRNELSVSEPLQFRAANQTIVIAVSLVTRAHLLQATVCHRRVQYKRALQCLAEARKWVRHQFTETARARSLRLLWADLQERWDAPDVQRATAAYCGAAGLSPSSGNPQYVDAALLPELPHFACVMHRLMELEKGACEAMIAVEECKVHHTVLQASGSLPPPPLLPCTPSSFASSSTAAALSEQQHEREVLHGHQRVASAATAGHAPDLRVHYRRYVESVQQLHRVSRLYMNVVDWIESEYGGEDEEEEEAEHKSIPVEQPHQQPLNIKQEEVTDDCDAAAQQRSSTHALSKASIRLVQSQISPFCLCALHRLNNAASAPPPAERSEEEENERGAPHRQQLPSSCSSSVRYAVNFDLRLAAEVLGWYHCVSFLYLLYQQPSSLASVEAAPSSPFSPIKLENAPVGREGEEAEAAFLSRHPRDALPGKMRYTIAGVVKEEHASRVSSHVTHDPVQRALEHFRVYAWLFGGVPSMDDTEQSCRTTTASASMTRSARWRAHVTSGSSADLSHSNTESHEAALLLCLAELTLRDNYPFVLRFPRGGSRGNAANESTPGSLSVASAAKTEAADGREALRDTDEAPLRKVKAEPEDGETVPVTSLATRKRARSPMSDMGTAAVTDDGVVLAPASVTVPPPSWSWVLPGVRTIVQLYVELTVVLLQAASTTPAAVSAAATATAASSAPSAHTHRKNTLHASSSSGAAAAAGAPSLTTASPAIPVLVFGLPRAEQLMARLLFHLDKEMLQLTGNAWSAASPPSSTTISSSSRAPRAASKEVGQQPQQPSPAQSHLGATCVDHLQCSSPAQLRWLVQLKIAALLTMSRHHLTQLSIVRSVHYLRDVQQFTRVFHRQSKLSLLPEMHVLLAAVAGCMALRQLPPVPSVSSSPQQHRYRNGTIHAHGRRLPVKDELLPEKAEEEETREEWMNPKDASANATEETSLSGETLLAFAQGWAAVEGNNRDDTHHSNTTAAAAHFSISPDEEATIAQDVGLPYLHLLAAERAACATLHTSPAFLLLLYLLKAWLVYELVEVGEELTWAEAVAAAPHTPSHAPAPPPFAVGPTSSTQQQRPPQQATPGTAPSAAGDSHFSFSPLSPISAPLPSPSVSYATTSLSTTAEDQQRRVARLDSLTSTPSSTPTLRGRHATLPAEMQRIQLDAAVPLLSPKLSPTVANLPASGASAAEKDGRREGYSATAPLPSSSIASSAVSDATRRSSKTGSVASASEPQGQQSPQAMAATPHYPPPRPHDVSPVPSPSLHLAIPPSLALLPYRHTNNNNGTTNGRGGPPVKAASTRPGKTPQVKAVPQTVRQRAADVLHRMLTLLRHHFDVASSTELLPAPSQQQRVPAAAWTPHNVTLFRLLHGAVLLTEEHDEPAAARELKEATHYAKQHLGVLHPYVADGLTLLARAYASLDVDSIPDGTRRDLSGAPTAPDTTNNDNSQQQQLDGAARTRRVAVQLAMRCSCTALASLSYGAAATTTTTAGANVLVSDTSTVHSRPGGRGPPPASTTPMHSETTPQQQPFITLNRRLQEWWSSQVLQELCGGGSGNAHRSAQAIKDLRSLFGWLPRTKEYML